MALLKSGAGINITDIASLGYPTGDPVTVTYPYDTGFSPQPLEWQMDSDYSFRSLGGYAHVANPNGDP